jgi:hypothetical protein
MQTQWYLCRIASYPSDEEKSSKITENLSVTHPDLGLADWYVWLPIIPRVGDTLQLDAWQVQVSNVILQADWVSKTGIREGLFVSAEISIREDVVPKLTGSNFSIDAKNISGIHKWETYARRGHDLQYYAWELKHKFYKVDKAPTKKPEYYRWHTRIRPVANDIIAIDGESWRVKVVELASANVSIDGWLTLEAVTNADTNNPS